MPGRRALTLTAAVLFMAAVAASCGDDGNERGGATLRFTGAVVGTMDTEMDIDCSPPAEPGGRFIVSFDSDEGVPVGGRNFMFLDVATPPYQGPRTYDLKQALAGDQELTQNFLMLFKELEDQAFLWGQDEDSSGTLTIDSGEASGRLSLRGWANSENLKVNIEGTFRCGEIHRGQQPRRGEG